MSNLIDPLYQSASRILTDPDELSRYEKHCLAVFGRDQQLKYGNNLFEVAQNSMSTDLSNYINSLEQAKKLLDQSRDWFGAIVKYNDEAESQLRQVRQLLKSASQPEDTNLDEYINGLKEAEKKLTESKEKYKEEAEHKKEIERQLRHVNCLFEKAIGSKSTDLYEHVKYLKDLLCECYADVAMLVLLNLRFNDYYTAVYQEELERLLAKVPSDRSIRNIPQIMRHYDRATLVCDAMDKVSPGWLPFPKFGWKTDKDKVEFLKDICGRRAHDFRDTRSWISDDYPGHTLYQEELIQIQHYLMECIQNLKENLKKYSETDTEAIRIGLAAVSENAFDWKGIRKFLMDQEKVINMFIENSEKNFQDNMQEEGT